MPILDRTRRRSLLCLITDRARLTGRADRGRSLEAVVAQVGGAAQAGVDLVQIREKDLAARDLCSLVERCCRARGRAATRVVVNERADVALAAGADGVHLRGDSIGAGPLRTLAPAAFIVGRSVHGETEGLEVALGGDLDYLLLGSVFETQSKAQGHPTVDLGVFARLAPRVRVPVLAVGGLTLDRLPSVVRAGAAGAAAIGLFIGAPGSDPAESAADAVRRARAVLDAATACQ